jgi:prolyl-tRNA synthetase
MIVPIAQRKPGVLEKAAELQSTLVEAGYKVKVDDSDKSPGWKFNEQEIRGIPLRVEIGPKDIEEGQAIIVRRDTREKIVVSLDELAAKIGETLENMQNDMLERAKAHLESHIYEAKTYDEFKDIIENKPGFVKMMWCGDLECELKVKEDTTATSRCMPFEQEQITDVCPVCGKPAKKMVFWGKAY